MKTPSPRPAPFKLSTRRSATGFGLFAGERIPKNRFVIEYWGKLITDDEANYVGGKYLFEIGNGKTIVGTTRENIARYINHACNPNCESRTVGNRIYIHSIRPIKPGEELTYDYGKEYFNHYIKPHGCRCETCARRISQKKTKKPLHP